ncbi:hypothetical protein ACXYMN_16210 [Roseivivax sp. CAU 1753]
MTRNRTDRKLPRGFWPLIAAAVLLGNAALLALIRLGAPEWLAAAAPTTAVGLVGVILAWCQRTAARRKD